VNEMSDRIGNTEALEGYLKLERENKRLLDDNRIYKFELEKMKKAYSDISSRVDILFNWFENKTTIKTVAVQRKMAILFKFAYMEGHFEDMRAKWPNPEARASAERMYPTKSDSLTKNW
jgi:hypothetical protein